MARVLRAVSSRVPSSASSAVSPSGWIRTRVARGAGGGEGGGGICGHKDGVEDAWKEADAEQADAGYRDDPRSHDRRRDQVPGRKIALHPAQGSRQVEKVPGPPGRREATRPMRHEKEQQQTPWQGEQHCRDDWRVSLGKLNRVGERV